MSANLLCMDSSYIPAQNCRRHMYFTTEVLEKMSSWNLQIVGGNVCLLHQGGVAFFGNYLDNTRSTYSVQGKGIVIYNSWNPVKAGWSYLLSLSLSRWHGPTYLVSWCWVSSLGLNRSILAPETGYSHQGSNAGLLTPENAFDMPELNYQSATSSLGSFVNVAFSLPVVCDCIY